MIIGPGPSRQLRKAAWKATGGTKNKLFGNGLLPEKARTVSPGFHIESLGGPTGSS
jgi:hypothetical protein